MDKRRAALGEADTGLQILRDTGHDSGRSPTIGERLTEFGATVVELLDVNKGTLKLAIERLGILPGGKIRNAWDRLTTNADRRPRTLADRRARMAAMHEDAEIVHEHIKGEIAAIDGPSRGPIAPVLPYAPNSDGEISRDAPPATIVAILSRKPVLHSLFMQLWSRLGEFVSWEQLEEATWRNDPPSSTYRVSVVNQRLNEVLQQVKGCPYRAEATQAAGARLYDRTLQK